MTSRSRRKHRITVRNTPPRNRKTPASQSDLPGDRPLLGRPLKVTFAAGLVVGLAVAACSVPGVADDFRRQQSAAGTVHSSSGQRGHKLKWLPYRPSVPPAGVRAVATERDVRTASKAPVRTARRPRGRAFEDPFGESGRSPRATTLAAVPTNNVPNESLPEKPPAQPAPDDSRPDFPFEKLPGAGPEADIESPPFPTTDQPFAQDQVEPAEECPSPYDPDYHTKIGELSSDILPEKGEFPRECTLTEETIQPFAAGQVRRNVLREPWAPTTFTWKASALCHKPLYFEEKHLERYGQSWGPYLQPLMSGAHFFLTVPTLPYKMGLYPPCECIYSLGYYRPGSCAPYMLDPLPLSIRAALAEGGVWTGMAFLIP